MRRGAAKEAWMTCTRVSAKASTPPCASGRIDRCALRAPRSSSAFRALCDVVRGAYGRTVAPAVQRGFHESHGKRY